MISGLSTVIIKENKDKDELVIPISSLYDIYGNKEIEIFHKGKFYKGSFNKHYSPEADLYRINTGSSFVDISGGSLINTSNGIKKVSDIRNSDLISCYEEDEDFSKDNEAFRSIYTKVPIKNDGLPLFSCSRKFTLENNIIISEN